MRSYQEKNFGHEMCSFMNAKSDITMSHGALLS